LGELEELRGEPVMLGELGELRKLGEPEELEELRKLREPGEELEELGELRELGPLEHNARPHNHNTQNQSTGRMEGRVRKGKEGEG
jgi:hypothetical protein